MPRRGGQEQDRWPVPDNARWPNFSHERWLDEKAQYHRQRQGTEMFVELAMGIFINRLVAFSSLGRILKLHFHAMCRSLSIFRSHHHLMFSTHRGSAPMTFPTQIVVLLHMTMLAPPTGFPRLLHFGEFCGRRATQNPTPTVRQTPRAAEVDAEIMASLSLPKQAMWSEVRRQIWTERSIHDAIACSILAILQSCSPASKFFFISNLPTRCSVGAAENVRRSTSDAHPQRNYQRQSLQYVPG